LRAFDFRGYAQMGSYGHEAIAPFSLKQTRI